ncbi:MAG: hypothetical protein PHW24_01440 [Candidatus Moranbacteria bacterium]|nr:hypothetical protein [Candidatus Moranbacteria bacterium]
MPHGQVVAEDVEEVVVIPQFTNPDGNRTTQNECVIRHMMNRQGTDALLRKRNSFMEALLDPRRSAEISTKIVKKEMPEDEMYEFLEGMYLTLKFFTRANICQLRKFMTSKEFRIVGNAHLRLFIYEHSGVIEGEDMIMDEIRRVIIMS